MKFRVKNQHTGKMREGAVLHPDGKVYEGGVHVGEAYLEFATGMYDMEGNEIYEGDILEVSMPNRYSESCVEKFIMGTVRYVPEYGSFMACHNDNTESCSKFSKYTGRKGEKTTCGVKIIS